MATKKEIDAGYATVEKHSFSIFEWCHRRGFSRTYYYELQKKGKGPRVTMVANRPRIDLEADRDWLRDQEAEAASEEHPDGRPGGGPAKAAMSALCWLILAASPDAGDPQLAEHLATIISEGPDPLDVSAIESVIAVLTDVAARLRQGNARHR